MRIELKITWAEAQEILGIAFVDKATALLGRGLSLRHDRIQPTYSGELDWRELDGFELVIEPRTPDATV